MNIEIDGYSYNEETIVEAFDGSYYIDRNRLETYDSFIQALNSITNLGWRFVQILEDIHREGEESYKVILLEKIIYRSNVDRWTSPR